MSRPTPLLAARRPSLRRSPSRQGMTHIHIMSIPRVNISCQYTSCQYITLTRIHYIMIHGELVIRVWMMNIYIHVSLIMRSTLILLYKLPRKITWNSSQPDYLVQHGGRWTLYLALSVIKIVFIIFYRIVHEVWRVKVKMEQLRPLCLQRSQLSHPWISNH